MDAFGHLLDGFAVALQPAHLAYVFLGCLLGERIAQFTAPVRGLALPSHTMPLGTLARQVSR